MRLALLLALCLLPARYACAVDSVAFGFVTSGGTVHFWVPTDWVVLTVDSKDGVYMAVYQVLNPADDGTPDSTNIAVAFYDLNQHHGQEASQLIGKRYGADPVVQSNDGEWVIYAQHTHRGDIQYVVIDAKKTVADVLASVRCAWPQLTKNPAGYDDQMQSICTSLWRSVEGKLGPPDLPPGAKIYRKVK